MTMSINSVHLSGNLTRDAELHKTDEGLCILSFGLAYNERRRKPDSEDEWENVTNFVDCVIFGNRAEALESYLLKGSKVSIKGRLRWRQWETDEGDKRSKHEVIVDELEFMFPRKEEGDADKSAEDDADKKAEDDADKKDEGETKAKKAKAE